MHSSSDAAHSFGFAPGAPGGERTDLAANFRRNGEIVIPARCTVGKISNKCLRVYLVLSFVVLVVEKRSIGSCSPPWGVLRHRTGQASERILCKIYDIV